MLDNFVHFGIKSGLVSTVVGVNIVEMVMESWSDENPTGWSVAS